MNRQRTFQYILGISLFVFASLACGLTGTIDRVREGQQAVQTLQGVATEIGESGVVETGQAIATQVDESGIKETAGALATEVGESGAKETVQAFATEIVVEPGELPPDIPIMDGEKEGFIGSEQAVSYFVKAEFEDVLNFYQSQMPANGWTEVETETTITDNTATFRYQKGDRQVDIVLAKVPFLGQVSVIMNIQ
jgi:hypothetical protein